MITLLDFSLTGLATGLTYALVGLGIALVYQVTGVINFAQGDFVMLGGLSFAVLTEGGLPEPLAALVALIGTTAVGAALNLLVIRPARNAGKQRLIILTIGASITIEGVALLVFGADTHYAPAFTGGTISVLGSDLPAQYLWCAAATVAAVGLMWLFLTRTLPGAAMRATAMDAEAARIMGISPARMSLLAFTLAAGLGALGGIVLAPLQPPDTGAGIALGLRGFTAAVLGGLSSPAGAVAGGLAVGLLQAYVTGYLSSGYRDVIVYAVLLVALLARPAVLLRRSEAVRV
jgi:branched-chain amino acid transport system permease protein